MRKKSSKNAGFTFVESLMAFSIVGVFLALTWATVQFLVVSFNEQIIRTRAHFLAMEGLEIVKQIRQTAVNRNRELGFEAAFSEKSGNYALVQNGDEFNLRSNESQVIKVDEFPYIDYCRQLSIEGPEDLKVIQSKVWWGDFECKEPNSEKQISYTTYLGNLKK